MTEPYYDKAVLKRFKNRVGNSLDEGRLVCPDGSKKGGEGFTPRMIIEEVRAGTEHGRSLYKMISGYEKMEQEFLVEEAKKIPRRHLIPIAGGLLDYLAHRRGDPSHIDKISLDGSLRDNVLGRLFLGYQIGVASVAFVSAAGALINKIS